MAKKRLIFFSTLALVLLFIFFPAFSKYQELMNEQRGLERRIEELEKVNEELEEEKQRLESDIEYIEKKAREKLGIVKKDEIPYEIE